MNIISCESSNTEVVTVGHIGEFDYDIWNQIDDELKIENARLELVYFKDYELLNKALNNGDIDLNSFQNYIYFVNETNEHNYNLHILGRTFVAPMNIYSKFLTNINQISSNATIAIPNDEVNAIYNRFIKESESTDTTRDKFFDNKAKFDTSKAIRSSVINRRGSNFISQKEVSNNQKNFFSKYSMQPEQKEEVNNTTNFNHFRNTTKNEI